MLCVLDAAFLGGLLLWPLIWLLNPLRFTLGPLRFSSSWGARPVLVVALLLAARVGWKALARRRAPRVTGLLEQPVIRKALLALAVTYALVGGLEGGLALKGYQADMAPVVFALDNAEGETERSTGYADPELRWRFRKGEMYAGRRINSLGYRDREVDPVKAPGARRIICLGDSVTAQGEPGYAELLHERLQADPPTTNAWEAFNMAVYGYSAMQGLRLFQLETRFLEPDVVTVFFGWNDHWIEHATDRTRMARKVSPFWGRLYNKLKTKRLFMLATQLSLGRRVSIKSRAQAGFRVPPAEYVQVLTDLVTEIRAVGARPILLTAPRRTVYPTKIRHPEVSRQINYDEVHDQYAELTRRVARDLEVDWVDLHQIMAAPAYDAVFLRDGIHLTQPGLDIIAEILDRKIRELFAGS